MPLTKCSTLLTLGELRQTADGEALYVCGQYDNGSKIVAMALANEGDPRTTADWIERDRAHNPVGTGVTSGKSASVLPATWTGPAGRTVTNFGHSLCMGFPWGSAYAAGYALSQVEGCVFTDLSRGGSVAAYPCSPGGGNNSGYARVLQAVRSGVPLDERVYIIHVGIADAAFWAYGTPGASFAVPYGHAITTMVSRLVSDKVWEIGPGATDGDLTWTWSGTWVDAASSGSTANGSGNGCRLCMADGSYGQATLPADWGGGTLAVGFVHSGQGNGATWQIDLTGANVGTYTFTQGADDADTGQSNGQVKRITGLANGATTVKITMTAHVGFLPGSLDYLQHEADPADAPEVMLVRQGPLAPSPLAGLSSLAGHSVTNAHFDICNSYLTAIATGTFAAFDSVHVVNGGIPPDDSYVWIAGGDGIHYKQDTYDLQGRNIAEQAQRLMSPVAEQMHAVYTRSDATGLYYGRFSARTRAWDVAAAAQVYATASPGSGKFAGAATDVAGSQAVAYVPSAGNSVKYKTLTTLGWSAEADLSSAAQTVTQVTAGPDRPAGRGHFFWQETTTPAIRHRAVESAAAVGSVAAAATDPHATWTASLSRPAGYIDEAGVRQLAVLYATSAPLWKALRFVSSAAPTFTAETVMTAAIPTGAVAPALACNEGALAATLSNSLGLFSAYNDEDGQGWRVGDYMGFVSAVSPVVEVYRRPAVMGGPIIMGVAYFDMGALNVQYLEQTLTPQIPARSDAQLAIIIGGVDYTGGGDASWSNTSPGGYETFQMTLSKPSAVRKLDRITVDVGGSRVWEGRVREIEYSGGETGVNTRITGEGYRGLLSDQAGAYIYMDRDLGSWGQGTNARTIGLLAAGYSPEWGSVANDQASPTVELGHQGAFVPIAIEAWYDAGPSCFIGRLRIGKVAKNSGYPYTSPFAIAAGMSEDDVATTYNMTSAPGWDLPMDVAATTATRRWGLLQILINYTGGAAADERRAWFQNIAVLGGHGLPIYTPSDGAAYSDDGLDPGDIARHVLTLQTSPLAVRPGQIDRSFGSQVIEQAVWKQPVPLEQIIQELATKAGWTWGVWSGAVSPLGAAGPVLDFHAPPSEATLVLDLGEAFEVSVVDSIANLYNRELVSYTTAGGMAGIEESERPTADLDGLAQRTEVSDLGAGSSGAALAYGSIRLALSDASRRGAGSIKLPDRVRRPGGGTMPSYLIRAGKERARITNLGVARPSPLRDTGTFAVTRVETSTNGTNLETRVEFDVGADLLEVLTARLADAVVAG